MEAKETVGDGSDRKYINRQFSDQNRQDAISRVCDQAKAGYTPRELVGV